MKFMDTYGELLDQSDQTKSDVNALKAKPIEAPVTQVKPAQSVGGSDFMQTYERMEQGGVELKNSLNTAVQTTPSAAAINYELGEKFQVPNEIAARYAKDFGDADKVKGIMDDLSKSNSEYLSSMMSKDPTFAAIAQDEVKLLSTLESNLKRMVAAGPAAEEIEGEGPSLYANEPDWSDYLSDIAAQVPLLSGYVNRERRKGLDVAGSKFAAKEGAAESGMTEEEYLNAAGFDGPIDSGQEIDPMTLAKVFGEGIADLGTITMGSIAHATQTTDMESVMGEDWQSASIASVTEERDKFKQEYGDKFDQDSGIMGMTYGEIYQTFESLGFSLVSMGAAVGGFAAAAPVAAAAAPFTGGASAVLPFAAAAGASGTAAYRMDTNMFTQEIIQAAQMESFALNGRPIPAGELLIMLRSLDGEITKHGLFEAIPEAISNVTGLKIISAPIKGAIGKYFGTGVLARFASKTASVYGTELATETVTQMGQQQASAEVSATGKVLLTGESPREWLSMDDWVQSFKDVAPQTILLTTMMLPLMAGANIPSAYNKSKLKKTLRDTVKEGRVNILPDAQLQKAFDLTSEMSMPEEAKVLGAELHRRQLILMQQVASAANPNVVGIDSAGNQVNGVDPNKWMQDQQSKKVDPAIANHLLSLEIQDLAQNSKSMKTLPVAIQGLVTKIANAGSIGAVEIDAEILMTFFQDANLNTDDERYVGLFKNLNAETVESMITAGESIEISLPDMISNAMQQPELQGLLEHIKFGSGAMSAAEAATFNEENSDIVGQLQELVGQIGSTAEKGQTSKTVRKDIGNQLRAAGFAPSVSDDIATLVEANFRTMGSLFKTKGVEDLFAQSFVSIRRQSEETEGSYDMLAQSGDNTSSPEMFQERQDIATGLQDAEEAGIISNSVEEQQNEPGIYQRSGDRGGRSTPSSLAPLQDAPSIEGFTGPDPELVSVADSYAREQGFSLTRQSEYTAVDFDLATRIAAEYEQMADAPSDPAVKEAYENLIAQTIAQYEVLVKAGYQFWLIDLSREDNLEYLSTPWNAMRDIRANKTMGIFSTADGHGSAVFDTEKNPLLASTPYSWPVGGADSTETMPVLANDLFRAVHDAFGHGLEGAGFRARGEENAWQAHSRLFTGSALGAITTETRGQNSWVNFGPYGEANQQASVEDTIFADQKVGLMPEWTWQEGVAGDMGQQQNEDLFQSFAGPKRIRAESFQVEGRYGEPIEGSVSVLGFHYSKEQRSTLEGSQYSTGMKGAEYARVRYAQDKRLMQRVHFYVDTGQGVAPESGVGSNIHAVNIDNVYDLREDALGLYRDALGLQEEKLNNMESAVIDAGFDGYYQSKAMYIPGASGKKIMGSVVLLGDHSIAVEQAQENETIPLLQSQSKARINDVGLYSSAEQAALNMNLPQWKKGGVARGADIWAKIKKEAGVKQEELTWLGLEEILTGDDTIKFSRIDVVNFIQSNGVVVEETVADEGSAEDFEFDWNETIDRDSENWNGRVEDDMTSYDNDIKEDDIYNSIIEQIMKEKGSDIRDSLDLTEEHDLADDTDVINWVDNNFASELRAAYESIIEAQAEEQYMDNPYIQYLDEKTDVEIFGNDDIGYTIRHNGEYVESNIWSFSEAEIQAQEYAMENELIEGGQGEEVAKWEQYVTDGDYDNYREIKLKLPGNTGAAFVESAHFDDENIVAFLRVDDRDLSTGIEPEQEDSRIVELEFEFVDQAPGSINKRALEIRDVDNGAVIRKVAIDLKEGQTEQDYIDGIRERAKKPGTPLGDNYKTNADGQVVFTPMKKTASSQSNNTLFVDEFQSDWHQQGRQKGYADSFFDEDAARDEIAEYNDEVFQPLIGNILDTYRGLVDEEPSVAFKDGEGVDFSLINQWANRFNNEDTVKIKEFIAEFGTPELVSELESFIADIPAQQVIKDQIEANRQGVPDAPFKDNAWMGLGLKRALVEAAEKGYDSFAWPDSRVLMNRWSERYQKLYEIQYDTKMPSMVKKLTKQKPIHLNMDGSPKLSRGDLAKNHSVVERYLDGVAEFFVVSNGVESAGFDNREIAEKAMDLNLDYDVQESGIDQEGYWVIPITDELRQKIKTDSFSMFQGQVEGPRGMFRQERDVAGNLMNVIEVTKTGDFTTALHEFGHLFLFQMNTFRKDSDLTDAGREMMKGQWGATTNWFADSSVRAWSEFKKMEKKTRKAAESDPSLQGRADKFTAALAHAEENGGHEYMKLIASNFMSGALEHSVALEVAFHELWAEGMEVYLSEGKAPTIELQSIFQTFAQWFKMIYKQLMGPDVKLSDEIREVMDRLFATDAEIAQAKAGQDLTPIFTNQEQSGLTDLEWAKYTSALDEATRQAIATLNEDKAKASAKGRSQAWKALFKDMKEDVTAELNQQPVYQAIQYLMHGKPVDGELPAGMEALKMSKSDVISLLPEGDIKKLKGRGKTGMYRVEGGGHPDSIAVMFGFPSGHKMLQEIIAAPDINDEAKRIAEERMNAEYGEEVTDEEKVQNAAKALHNDKAEELIETELNALTKMAKMKPRKTNLERDMARAAMGSKLVRDIKPGQWLQGQLKASQKAMKALEKGDMAEAVRWKQAQLINFYLYKEAINAADRIEKMRKKLATFSKGGTRKNLARGHLDQIDIILEQMDIKKSVPLKELDQRQSLSDFIAQVESAGFMIELTPIAEKILQSAEKTHYKDMTLDQFKAVYSLIISIENSARKEQMLINDNQKRTKKQAIDAMLAHVDENHKRSIEKVDYTDGLGKKIQEGASGFLAAHKKLEFVFREMDAEIITGPFWEFLFKGVADAETNELVMQEDAVKAIRAIFDLTPHSERKKWGRKIEVPGMGTMTKEALISLALNWGNEGNKQAVIGGNGWSEALVNQVLSEHITAQDGKMIQGIWDFINSYWPQIAELQNELSGVVPEKIQPTPVVFGGQTFAGGYYSLKYDPDKNEKSFKQEEKSKTEDLFEGNFMRPQTKNGHTKERVANVGRPVMLSLKVFNDHVNNVIHDLTHRKALLQIDSLSQDKAVQDMIIDVLGRKVYREIRPWLQNIANSQTQHNDVGASFWTTARKNSTIVNMGWKVTTGAVQWTGLFQTMEILGEKWTAAGVKEVFGNPAKTRAVAKDIMQRSPMMRNRMKTYDRDVLDSLKSIKGESAKDNLQRTYFMHIGFMDMGVSLPTWAGAYAKAISENLTEEQAVDFADSSVRQTQGAGGAKDLARIQRGSPGHRMFVMFYSYFSVLYNLMARRKGMVVRDKDIFRAFTSFMYLILLPAVLSELTVGRGPDEDEDEEFVPWAVKTTAMYPVNSIVFARDIVGGIFGDYGYSMTPLMDGLKTVVRGAKAVVDPETYDEEVEFDGMRLGVFSMGYLFGLPARQVWNMLDHSHDVMIEGEDFSMWEFLLRSDNED
tara:strand:+ start:3272 stop:13438 length:10167 start_codon:yes stop_codon:yes gene_type:complete